MSPDARGLAAYQQAFAVRIRAPRQAPRPAGVPARRMRVYEELLHNNLEGFLLACYPVSRRLLGARAWRRAVGRFFAEGRSPSPLFRDIPKAFLDWIAAQGEGAFAGLPFLAELMHYEWLELAVSIAPWEIDPVIVDPRGDLLAGRPVLHPSARQARYRYPVHRLGPRFKPQAPDGLEHGYLLFRDDADARDAVRFLLLNPLATRLLARMGEHPETGRQALEALAAETRTPHLEAFVEAGGELLAGLREQGALIGTWRLP